LCCLFTQYAVFTLEVDIGLWFAQPQIIKQIIIKQIWYWGWLTSYINHNCKLDAVLSMADGEIWWKVKNLAYKHAIAAMVPPWWISHHKFPIADWNGRLLPFCHLQSITLITCHLVYRCLHYKLHCIQLQTHGDYALPIFYFILVAKLFKKNQTCRVSTT